VEAAAQRYIWLANNPRQKHWAAKEATVKGSKEK